MTEKAANNSRPEKPRLNVILITYNHEKYIEECVKSILMQKTTFMFNVIVAEDKSTDSTLDIIIKCSGETDIPFVFLADKENLGRIKNSKRAFEACDAEYIATIEGDDFWTDPLRLQKHVDFLDNHYECVMSSNSYMSVDYENFGFGKVPYGSPDEGVKFLTARELIYLGGYASNASTCVYRKSVVDKLPCGFFDMPFRSDWSLKIMLAHYGLVAQLFEIMSVYRVTPAGEWSGLNDIERAKRIIRFTDEFNSYTGKKFDAECEMRKRTWALNLAPIADKTTASRLKRTFKIAKEFMPPIIIWIFKALLPQKVKNILNS